MNTHVLFVADYGGEIAVSDRLPNPRLMPGYENSTQYPFTADTHSRGCGLNQRKPRCFLMATSPPSSTTNGVRFSTPTPSQKRP